MEESAVAHCDVHGFAFIFEYDVFIALVLVQGDISLVVGRVLHVGEGVSDACQPIRILIIIGHRGGVCNVVLPSILLNVNFCLNRLFVAVVEQWIAEPQFHFTGIDESIFVLVPLPVRGEVEAVAYVYFRVLYRRERYRRVEQILRIGYLGIGQPDVRRCCLGVFYQSLYAESLEALGQCRHTESSALQNLVFRSVVVVGFLSNVFVGCVSLIDGYRPHVFIGIELLAALVAHILYEVVLFRLLQIAVAAMQVVCVVLADGVAECLHLIVAARRCVVLTLRNLYIAAVPAGRTAFAQGEASFDVVLVASCVHLIVISKTECALIMFV